MNFTHSYNSINLKRFQSPKYNPYLLSNKENISNNLIPMYVSSESNASNQKREINSYNDVKKSLNLDIPEFSNNTIDPKKNIIHNFHRYSSFSAHNSNNDRNSIDEKDTNKKTLILDLDETLVHSAFTPFSRKSDLTLTINFDGEDRLLYVLKRPYVDEFLSELSPFYEIIIFTASISEYANPLLDLLDKKKCIKHRLFREHCTYDNGIYIKDLKIFDRKINNMIIIDNNPLSYDNNVSNGIPILSWYEDINDKELLKLIPILKHMSNSDVYDVRNIINKIVDRNRNEIDYNAINKIVNLKNEERINSISNRSLTNNEYRKMNKSVEPKRNILNNNNNNKKEEEKYDYNQFENKIKMLKNNFNNKYGTDNANTNILNSKYNIHNINNYDFAQKPNLNIDKKDPLGTRISIFSPEEYNTSYKYKSYRFPFNRNMYTINYMEESKDDNFSKTIIPQQKEKNYLFEKYSQNKNLNKMQMDRSLSYKKDDKKINKYNYGNETATKVYRTHSLVELTKKALHLIEIQKENKNNGYDSVSKALNKNKFFNEENKLIYNNYIKGNKYIKEHKSENTSFKNNIQTKYFRNYIQEYKNIEKNANDKINNIYNKINSLKQITSNNKNDIRIVYNNNFNNSEKDRLLKRMNNEKINNFLFVNYPKESNNYENKYKSNYSQIDKNSYINIIKKTIEKNKANLNMKVFNNSNINYQKNKNNLKMYNNKRYDLLSDYKNREVKNIAINHKSVSYIKNKGNNLINLKQTNTNRKEMDKINSLLRSSSYVKSNVDLNKIMNNGSLINISNKENERNNINNNYVDNLNYRYDINMIDI